MNNNRNKITFKKILVNPKLGYNSTIGIGRNSLHLLASLVLSTTIYFIWYERNNRVLHQAYCPHHIVNE
jgi:hypothetical protein